MLSNEWFPKLLKVNLREKPICSVPLNNYEASAEFGGFTYSSNGITNLYNTVYGLWMDHKGPVDSAHYNY